MIVNVVHNEYSTQPVQYVVFNSHELRTTARLRHCTRALLARDSTSSKKVVSPPPPSLGRTRCGDAFLSIFFRRVRRACCLGNGRFSYDDKERVSHPTTAQYE